MDSGNGYEYNQNVSSSLDEKIRKAQHKAMIHGTGHLKITPEDIMPGAVQYLPPGTDIKFIKDNIGKPNLAHLMKIKHLFYASCVHRIDFRPVLKVLGVERIPSDLEAFKCLNMGFSELGLIDCLYEAQRSI